MKKFCPICHGACRADHIEKRVDHPLVTILKREMALGEWTGRNMAKTIGRDLMAVHYILKKGHGFSPKLNILTAMLYEVGITLHWTKILNWTPERRLHARPALVGVQTKPHTKIRRFKPHPMILELKACRIRQGVSMHDIEVVTGLNSSAISDMETGRVGDPHITTAQTYGMAVGMRLIYREI